MFHSGHVSETHAAEVEREEDDEEEQMATLDELPWIII